MPFCKVISNAEKTMIRITLDIFIVIQSIASKQPTLFMFFDDITMIIDNIYDM